MAERRFNNHQILGKIKGKGIKTMIEGSRKDFVRIKYFRLESYQMTCYLKDDLQIFADAGLEKIYVEDSAGEIRHINKTD